MFDAIINRQRDLLIIHFSEAVDREQTRESVERVKALTANLKPGFTVITDMGRLKHMDFDCAQDVGELMDLCNKAGVSHVCRVIPSREVDIGWNIISRFHYDEESVRINTYPTFYQAMKSLILEAQEEKPQPAR